MARANLQINPGVTEAFISAQDISSRVRLLSIKIENESLVLGSVAHRLGSAESDFADILGSTIVDNEAALILFCLTDEHTTSLSWLLVAWVPDGCKVRDKMLYTSSRDDLKRSLGLGYFTSEYAANIRADLTWEAYRSSISKDKEKLWTEGERLVMEENMLHTAESTAVKSTAMGVLPFDLSPETISALESFKNGSCNWVELSVASERVNVTATRTVTAGDSVQQYVSDTEARFFAVKLPVSGSGGSSAPAEAGSLSFFVFSCPENVPVRQKMTMSSCKATVIAAAGVQGLIFDRYLAFWLVASVLSWTECGYRHAPSVWGFTEQYRVSHSPSHISVRPAAAISRPLLELSRFGLQPTSTTRCGPRSSQGPRVPALLRQVSVMLSQPGQERGALRRERNLLPRTRSSSEMGRSGGE